MKKSLVLGAAALAAVMMAAPQNVDAGETKIGGYYMFRVQDSDNTLGDTGDENRYWAHRLQLNMDFIHDEKTHAHFVTRVLDSGTVEGSDETIGRAATDTNDDDVLDSTPSHWDVRQLWLETELFGTGVKVGNMPIALNDDILINDDTSGFGAIMLSRNLGDISVVLADVRVDEGDEGGDKSGDMTDNDDVDLYVLSLFGGDESALHYNITGAYLRAQDGDSDNYWVALTVGQGTKEDPLSLTGTIIYEDGQDGMLDGTTAVTTMQSEDGFLMALRVNSNVGGGTSWNAYGFWADENFTNIVNDNMGWSPTWDMGGPGAKDLMSDWADSAGSGSSPSENMAGLGIGLTIERAGWTIHPVLDYATVVEDAGATSSSAWGGGVKMSKKINKATTLGLTGLAVEPDNAGGADNGTLHYAAAYLKMKF